MQKNPRPDTKVTLAGLEAKAAGSPASATDDSPIATLRGSDMVSKEW